MSNDKEVTKIERTYSDGSRDFVKGEFLKNFLENSEAADGWFASRSYVDFNPVTWSPVEAEQLNNDKEEQIDIFAPIGTKMTVSEKSIQSGYDHHSAKAKKFLKPREVYTLDKTEIGSWHTDFYLTEIPNEAFNSVHFIKPPVEAEQPNFEKWKGWLGERIKLNLSDWDYIQFAMKEYSRALQAEVSAQKRIVATFQAKHPMYFDLITSIEEERDKAILGVSRLTNVLKESFDVWNEVDEYVRNHPEIKIGESVSKRTLEFLKERDAITKELDKANRKIEKAFTAGRSQTSWYQFKIDNDIK